MRTIYSRDQLLHDPKSEVNRGQIGPAFERPERARMVLEAVRSAALGAIDPPRHFPKSAIAAIHDATYLDFLRDAHDQWRALGRAGDAIPLAWPIRSFRSDRVPRSLDGRLSLYSFDISTPLTAGTWRAARAAADVALTGASLIAGRQERAVFALCRPPGHHAGIDFYGGYCFINNAAVAAQHLIEQGAGRVAILDVDYHHGNGTQQIFYRRDDVLYVSIHADPATDFPYFLGYADESGEGAGAGFNYNLPLPQGVSWPLYAEALTEAERRIKAFAPDALVVSLGVDTFEDDPLSQFRLTREDFARLGDRLAALAKPTLIVLEGGYAVDELGFNVIQVLSRFV